MLNRRAGRWLGAGFLSALVLTLVFWPVSLQVASQPMEQPAESPQSPAISATYLVEVIPAAAFRDNGSFGGYFFPFAGGYLQGSPGQVCLMAPVYLPNYAMIDIMYASVYDHDAAANLYVDLYRVNNYTGTRNYMGGIVTTDVYSSPNLEVFYDDTINWPSVFYPDYTYYLGTCLDSPLNWLFSVRIWYYMNYTYLPLLKK